MSKTLEQLCKEQPDTDDEEFIPKATNSPGLRLREDVTSTSYEDAARAWERINARIRENHRRRLEEIEAATSSPVRGSAVTSTSYYEPAIMWHTIPGSDED